MQQFDYKENNESWNICLIKSGKQNSREIIIITIIYVHISKQDTLVTRNHKLQD